MQQRYKRLQKMSSNVEVKELANQLLLRISEATLVLEKLVEVYTSYGIPELHDTREEHAFTEGFSALQYQDLSRAHRLFTTAYEEQKQSPRNLAFMAWTLLLLKGINEHKQVIEYLQLSESLQPNVVHTQYFMATAEAQNGNIARAKQRLHRIIRRGNATEEVQSLYQHLLLQRLSQRS